MNRVVDLADKLALFSEHWAPKVVARLNDYEVKVVKLKGEFVWHSHDDTDELFLVVEGTLTIQLRDGRGEHGVTVRPGQLYVVPRGVEHRPVADGDVSAVLIEPAGVVNTGSAQLGSPEPSPTPRPHPGALAAWSHLDGPPARPRHSAWPGHPSGDARNGDARGIQAQRADLTAAYDDSLLDDGP